jgi:gliding motility-associated-like protein/uncharacterized repeat protein (TIGR01451 family)
LGSTASAEQSINIYDAYYKKQVVQVTCRNGDIEDVLFGVNDLGVADVNATVGVADAWNIADGDASTYATMYRDVGILATAELTSVFRTPSIATDSLKIVISSPGETLSVDVLTDFIIQLYFGDTPVGDPIESTSSDYNYEVLSEDSAEITVVASQSITYDRVILSLGGAVGLLDRLFIHHVYRVANTKVVGVGPNNSLVICAGEDVILEVAPEICSDYVWYDAPIGGNVVANGQTFSTPSTLTAGIYKFYIQPVRYGCEYLSRGEVTIDVLASPLAPTTNDTKQNFCSVNNPKVSDIQVNESNVVWYRVSTGGTVLATTTPLESGSYYGAIQDSETGCESSVRLLVSVTTGCSDLSITHTVDNQTPALNEEVSFTITVYNNGIIDSNDIIIDDILPNGYSFVRAITVTGSYNKNAELWNIPILAGNQSAILTIVAQVLESGNYLFPASIVSSDPVDQDVSDNYAEAFVTPMCLTVYNVFTPNSDGINDVFKIDCIENYPNNKLSIYNRYGDLVYNKENYNNDWEGMANVSAVVNQGDKLPSGTYYYVIDIGTAEKAKSGWLSIIR